MLESLHFSGIWARQKSIAIAHSATYEWIFESEREKDDSHLGFMQWLMSQNGIFWINGKAGSGKSTLMKFVANHPQTMQGLQRWAG